MTEDPRRKTVERGVEENGREIANLREGNGSESASWCLRSGHTPPPPADNSSLIREKVPITAQEILSRACSQLRGSQGAIKGGGGAHRAVPVEAPDSNGSVRLPMFGISGMCIPRKGIGLPIRALDPCKKRP